MDNFAATTPQTISFPGVDGGVSAYGDKRPPSPVGQVQVSLWIHATPSTMVAALDAIRGLSAVGYQSLVMQPSGYGTARRYCNAVLREASIRQSVGGSGLSQYNQEVDLTFIVPRPYWIDNTASQNVKTMSGSQATVTLTGGGNYYAVPKFTIGITSGSDLVIERLSGSNVIDKIAVDGTFSSGDSLVIDCESYAVTLNGDNAYDDDFSFLEPRWLILDSGSNSLRISAFTGQVTTDWRARWL